MAAGATGARLSVPRLRHLRLTQQGVPQPLRQPVVVVEAAAGGGHLLQPWMGVGLAAAVVATPLAQSPPEAVAVLLGHPGTATKKLRLAVRRFLSLQQGRR